MMSADNGVYILQTPTEYGCEYRVAHVCGIDDMVYDDANGDPETVLNFFGRAPIFTDHTAALIYASQIARQQPILEYGVVDVELPCPFSQYILMACGPALH